MRFLGMPVHREDRKFKGLDGSNLLLSSRQSSELNSGDPFLSEISDDDRIGRRRGVTGEWTISDLRMFRATRPLSAI